MKVKKITMEMLMVAILMIACIIVFPNNVNAAVGVTRNIYSNNGSMKFNFTGLTLNEEHEYEYGLTATKGAEVKEWYDIVEMSKSTANVNITTITDGLRNVINKTDTGYITIRDKTSETKDIVLKPYAVDLKIPYLKLTNYTVVNNGYNFDNINIALRNADNSKAYYQYVKITDENIIKKYEDIKEKNGDFNELQGMLATNVPQSNWKTWRYWNGYSWSGMDGYGYPQETVNAPDTGLYYMWLYFSGNDIKDIYGYILVDNLEQQGPKVKEIKVVSPKEGTYNAPQTVEILVRFDEKIKGSKVPTLKIKFGDSEERSLTNGTIKNDYYLTTENGVIIYSYNIQAGDEGQLAVVSLTGGNITDEKGNEAKISCPVLTGNTIKANTEGQVNNQTQNQDITNNNNKPSTNNNQSTGTGNTGNSSSTGSGNSGTQNGSSANGGSSSSNNGSTSNSGSSSSNKGTTSGSSNNGSTTNNKPSGTNTSNNNSNSKDDTTVKGKLPQTGVNEGVIAVIAVIAVIGVVMYVRYRKMKDIN